MTVAPGVATSRPPSAPAGPPGPNIGRSKHSLRGERPPRKNLETEEGAGAERPGGRRAAASPLDPIGAQLLPKGTKPAPSPHAALLASSAPKPALSGARPALERRFPGATSKRAAGSGPTGGQRVYRARVTAAGGSCSTE